MSDCYRGSDGTRDLAPETKGVFSDALGLVVPGSSVIISLSEQLARKLCALCGVGFDRRHRTETAKALAAVMSGERLASASPFLRGPIPVAQIPRVGQKDLPVLTRIANEAFTDETVAKYAKNIRGRRRVAAMRQGSNRSTGPRLEYFRRIHGLARGAYRFVIYWRPGDGRPGTPACAYTNRRILGYTAVIPLNRIGSELYATGRISQFEFDASHVWVPTAEEPVPPTLYFQALYLRRRQHLGFRSRLVHALARTVADFAPAGFIPADGSAAPTLLIGEATETPGRALLGQLFGEHRLGKSADGHDIYSVPLGSSQDLPDAVRFALHMFSSLVRAYGERLRPPGQPR